METDLKQARLILASGSPRRRELLAMFDIPFAVVPSQAEEKASGIGVERVRALARLKCDEVFGRMNALPVLAADTLVCVEDGILGKPRDAADAKRMLMRLSDRWHEVHTGVCLRLPDGCVHECVETTRVRFCALAPSMIDAYVATGEPMDKAGAYAIQERAGVFVERIEGSPSNVIGLPLCAVGKLFRLSGLILNETDV